MTDKKDLGEIRREYAAAALSAEGLVADPLSQFAAWFEEAKNAEERDPTAMTLATSSAEAGPSARIVLLKHFDAEGFCWYTDYDSHKGQQLAENPQAELLFYWSTLERQVRISGVVSRLDRSHAEQYFNERPLGSRLSAAASQQSHPVADRETLEKRVVELQNRYPQGDVPCPQHWGGYSLQPQRFEFWQGRENRLHDRFQYRLNGQVWLIERLCP